MPQNRSTLIVQPTWNHWSQPTTSVLAAHRAGGRRAYNATRRFQATMRRRAVLEVLLAYGFTYGSQQRAAEALRVGKATISRDTALLRAWWLEAGGVIWPADLRMPKAVAHLMADA